MRPNLEEVENHLHLAYRVILRTKKRTRVPLREKQSQAVVNPEEEEKLKREKGPREKRYQRRKGARERKTSERNGR